LKLIRSSALRSFLSIENSSRFGLLTVKGQNDIVSVMNIYIYKAGSTGSHRANSRPVFYLDSARPQTRVDPPGRTGFQNYGFKLYLDVF